MKTLNKLGIAGIAILVVLIFIFQCYYELAKIDELKPPANASIAIAINNASIFIALKLVVLVGVLYFIGVYVYEIMTILHKNNIKKLQGNQISNVNLNKVKDFEDGFTTINKPVKELVLDKELSEVFDMPITPKGDKVLEVPIRKGKSEYEFISLADTYLKSLENSLQYEGYEALLKFSIANKDNIPITKNNREEIISRLLYEYKGIRKHWFTSTINNCYESFIEY